MSHNEKVKMSLTISKDLRDALRLIAATDNLENQNIVYTANDMAVYAITVFVERFLEEQCETD